MKVIQMITKQDIRTILQKEVTRQSRQARSPQADVTDLGQYLDSDTSFIQGHLDIISAFARKADQQVRNGHPAGVLMSVRGILSSLKSITDQYNVEASPYARLSALVQNKARELL